MVKKITRATIGYTVCMYRENGGGISTWVPTMNEVFETIKTFEKSGYHSIAIARLSYKNRMRRMVVQRATRPKDCGISTPYTFIYGGIDRC